MCVYDSILYNHLEHIPGSRSQHIAEIPCSNRRMHNRHRSTHSPQKSSRHSSSSTPLSTSDPYTHPHGAHSLAHELAVALMPEPDATSKLLAEEFGIEYDEGIEEETEEVDRVDDMTGMGASLAEELGGGEFGEDLVEGMGGVEDDGPVANGSVGHGRLAREGSDDEDDDDDDDASAALAQDAMEILAQNLASTDRFLEHLRVIDMPPPSATPSPLYTKLAFTTHASQMTGPSTFTVERLASDSIRRINSAVREREVQLRELIACDRDFKRISVEVGGADVLGDLESLVDFESESESESGSQDHPPGASDKLGPLMAGAAPSLANLREHTASLLSSLTTISEQAQVNGAATADAGRKIRSLKNRLGGWKAEWEAAERSQTRIKMWDAEGKAVGRIDGRTVVAEHMSAFGKAVEEAGLKTLAIMAR